MANKRKKPSRKYTPRSEFRYCFAKSAGGKNNSHPHYIFGEKGNKYYSLGLTTHPNKKYPYYSLSYSPNPNCSDPQSVQIKPFIENKKFYSTKTKNFIQKKQKRIGNLILMICLLSLNVEFVALKEKLSVMVQLDASGLLIGKFLFSHRDPIIFSARCIRRQISEF